jgi:hypothetical protein
VSDDLVKRSREAADWVAAQQSPDGSLPPFEAGVTPYYKAPACLATGGQFEAGGRLARWVRDTVITADGDFEWAEHPRDRGMALFWPYPNAWMVYGFARLGQWDLAQRGAAFLAKRPYTGDVDIFPLANAGNALVATGHLVEADRFAAIVRRGIDEQPDIERGLHTVWRVPEGGTLDDGALATEFKESHGWRFLLAHEPRRQMTFIPGMCATFLVRHALATGSAESMAAAKAWIEGVCRNEPHIYEWPETGKVGWAAALHHGATGDPRTRQVAERVRDFLCDTQADDGSWPRDDLANTLDVTAEFGVILGEIGSALG